VAALGGLLAFRSESLDRASSDLGRNAVSLALTFNAQSALGQDLLGQSLLVAAAVRLHAAVLHGLRARRDRATPGIRRQPDLVSAAFVDAAAVQRQLLHRPRGNSDYRLNSDGASVTLTRLADEQAMDGGRPDGGERAVAAVIRRAFELASSGAVAGGCQLSRSADARRGAQDRGQSGSGRRSAPDPAAAPIRTAEPARPTPVRRDLARQAGPAIRCLGRTAASVVVRERASCAIFRPVRGCRSTVERRSWIASTDQSHCLHQRRQVTLVGRPASVRPPASAFSDHRLAEQRRPLRAGRDQQPGPPPMGATR
jgi:hypothetical protein